MGYLGTPASVGFSRTTKDRFSGDNSTTGFTMSQAANTATDIQVFVDNIRQEPTIAYSVSGATLTFTEAPPTGTNNVYVVHQHQALGTGTLPPQDLGSKDYIFGDDISLQSDSAVINFGLDSEVTLTHNHNTGLDLNLAMTATTFEPDGDTSAGDSAAIGHTSAEGLILTGQGSTSDVTIKNDADVKVMAIPTGTRQVHIGDASANDSAIVFDGNAQDFHIGLDDSADSLTIGLGSTLGTTSHMIFDENGHISKPLQPAFLITKNSAQTGIAVNTNQTIDFDTEVFDQNGDFASSAFTAPITGRYQFNVIIYTADAPNDLAYFTIRLVTSNRTYYAIFDPGQAGLSGANAYHTLHINVLADMDANDTAFVNCYTPSGSGSTKVDGSHVTSFSGYLVA
tara:strand:+ start:235 stop:1425 length:1191 start_codon:yes stop_codon:yes gene_type:complete